MAFIIKPAVRTFQPVLIGLWGGSSSGKTFSAFRLARGLVGPKGKIGVIDTENRRALFYAGEVGGQWDHLDFPPKFTPERLTEAFRTYENAGGYDCIIIDSISHIWEGEGGVLDQADNNKSTGLNRWAAPKMAVRRMINTLIRSQIHVIFCMRAKMGVSQGADNKVQSNGLEPIMEKGLIFEMLVSILLGPDQKPLFKKQGDRYWVNHLIPAIKAPKEIRQTIREGEYLSEATGEAILAWLNSASRDVADEANRAASRGVEAFRAWWRGLSPEHKATLKPLVPELQAKAERADLVVEETELQDEAPVAAEENPDEPFKDPFTPPAKAKPEPAKAAKTPLELSKERFEHGLGSVDWFYDMADRNEDLERGKRGVEALLALAKTLGPEFVERFNARKKQMWDRTSNTGQATADEAGGAFDDDPFNDGGNPPTVATVAPAIKPAPAKIAKTASRATKERTDDDDGVTIF